MSTSPPSSPRPIRRTFGDGLEPQAVQVFFCNTLCFLPSFLSQPFQKQKATIFRRTPPGLPAGAARARSRYTSAPCQKPSIAHPLLRLCPR